MYNDITCPLGCGEIDNLPHLLICSILRKHHKSNSISIVNHKYEDIFSEDIQIQKSVTEIFKQVIQIRNELISQPVAELSGPMQSNNCDVALQSNNLCIT